jgi:hypothetical protein
MALYIAAGTLAATCRPRTEALVPIALAPAHPDSAIAWTRMLQPAQPAAIRFRWRYEDERARWAGRGTARVAPPDSLRIDYAGPLGLGAGAGVVVGDSVVWAEPRGDFRRLVPAIPMLWSALGMVRPPAEGARVFTRMDGGGGEGGGSEVTVRYWRFVLGVDTLDYALSRGRGRVQQLEAEWRRNGGVVARSRTQFDDGRWPANSRIDLPHGPALMEFTVADIDTAADFPPDLWHQRD